MKQHNRQFSALVFGLSQNLCNGSAVDSKRSKSVVEGKHEIHERSSIMAAARATWHQRSGISPKAPRRFVRDPAKLVALYTLSLRSKRFLCDSVISNSTTTTLPLRSWRFICVFLAFMLLSWRLNFALSIICQHSKHFKTRFTRFIQNASPSKSDGEFP